MNPRLDLALKLLEAGLVESAAIPVAQVLERDPDDPRAHHLAGLIARRGGDGTLALAAFTRGLAVAADDAPLRIERAGLLLDLGRAEEALADLGVALALAPDHQAVLSTQGRVLIDLGRPDEALVPLRRACALAPDDLAPAHNLGRALLALDRPNDALPVLEAAVARAPAAIDPQADLAETLRRLDRPQEAAQVLRAALDRASDRADLADALAGALLAAGSADESVAVLRASLDKAPTHGAGWVNLAAALIETGALGEATAAADRALALDPDDADAKVNRAFARCLADDYEQGFADYAHRWRTAAFQRPYPPVTAPPWAGEALGEGTLLVRGEQGLGDQIMAARFLPWLSKRPDRPRRIVFECHPCLHRLLADGLEAGIELLAMGSPPPPVAAWIGALDLARMAGVTAGVMPVDVPYLRALPLDSPLASRPPAARGRLGLVWAGKTRPRDRSCPLDPLAALCVRQGWRVHALQLGPRRADLAGLPAGLGVIDEGDRLGDMAATASVMSGLDLVVAVDTAVAHLAGALGLPCALLLLATPDWRWGQKAPRTVWYPSLRLFRQPHPGDWDGAFGAVERAFAQGWPFLEVADQR
ncbi:hypothetical protein CKO38_11760 [Rhodospirillum rubrum]|uniref:tetratricopeptide repeat protein n=1 Tax=Rhodospirillum rubrum TaxID=1085 RepID=UPI0019084AB7|nr:tetratricopeptide repeat protein [Rhodospirillum rubrum]MBK1665944.1 hypothetical protein [Rhodospirillum rubrum]MBK1677329.1 hypothetical protein [Rhodospirillum rubrum]